METLVTIGQGTLQGKVLQTRHGRPIWAFQGIPYAAPPTGDLRFQDPKKPPTWTGTRPAKKEGNDCIQKHYFKGEFVGSEDCLYLNVYTPEASTNREAKLPVMVYIHGGGFFAGSGSTEMYGPEFLLDHDIVLVTLNFRLSTLGFLNLGTTDVLGNFGLKDQVAALKWVKSNIAAFGGDPDCVTVFGESAGGASVHYLLISPLAKGLFHRAILQSGSAFNPWAFRSLEESVELSQEICEKLIGEPCLDPSSLLKLKEVSAQRCAEEGKNLKMKYKLQAELLPSVERQNSESAFLTKCPKNLKVANVPIMIGVTTHEGMLELEAGADLEKRYKDNFAHFVPYRELNIAPNSPQCRETWRKIDKFYDDISNGDFTEKYIHINSDIDFVCGVDDLVQNTVKDPERGEPVFYYQFSYDGNLGFYKKKAKIERKGTCHTDELSYLFTRQMTPWSDVGTQEDFQVIDNMTELWTNFAKFGNPTPYPVQGEKWNAVSKNSDGKESVMTQYLEIGAILRMHPENMFKERMHFWRKLLGNE
ncbi:juvenile hormone esterase-like [Neocloeon triangulifer]|uniref:juvenile hormone esterase-like n=1 Tax=Neocloeon triangulifer TaxID=2078957 RepID=UPI00286F6165|nr:juvenile hormone esterase-like [Neocloeon triangulifer]